MGSEDLQSPEGQQALEALGVASEEVAAEEEQAASALARALGHNQVADGAGNMELEDIIVRASLAAGGRHCGGRGSRQRTSRGAVRWCSSNCTKGASHR